MTEVSNANARPQPREAGLLVRGSLIELRRRCGKANCRCREGELHATWALSYSVKGRTRLLTLRPKDLPAVRQALRRYRQAAAALERRALRGIERLAERVRTEKARERKGKGGRR